MREVISNLFYPVFIGISVMGFTLVVVLLGGKITK